MLDLSGQTIRLLNLDRTDRNRWSVRWRSVFPHRGFREHQRVPLWHPALPFVLITSQKAGSTLGTAWFLQHAGLLEEAKAHDPFVHHYEQEIFLRQAGYFDGLENAIAEKPVFKLVREPGARAFSSYMALQVSAALTERDHRFAIRRRIARAEGLEGPLARMPFRSFLRWVAGQDHQRLDGHEARQTNLYEDDLPGGTPEPIKLEEVGTALPALEERFGLPRTSQSQLSALGASSHYVAKTGDAADFGVILEDGVSLPRPAAAPKVDSRLIATDGEALADLVAAYGEDFERYGYPVPKPGGA